MEKKPKPRTVAPTVHFALACDEANLDEAGAPSGSWTLAGVRFDMAFESFPGHTKLDLCFGFAHIPGDFTAVIRAVRLADGRYADAWQGPVTVSNRLRLNILRVRLDDVSFPEPGRYVFRLFADGVEVVDIPFIAFTKGKVDEEIVRLGG